MYYTNFEINSILDMDYDPKYKYSDENIYCSDIFTVDNYKIMHDEKNKWRYNKEKFQWGRENKKLFPSLMIYLILATYKYKKVITSNEYEQVVLDKYKLCGSAHPYTDEQILIGRSYQTYASYLRELDFINQVNIEHPNAKVYKNPNLDLCEGIDFTVDFKTNTKYIALKHEGRTSDLYDYRWKNEKEKNSPYEIVRVIAKHDKGDLIELISNEDIKKINKP